MDLKQFNREILQSLEKLEELRQKSQAPDADYRKLIDNAIEEFSESLEQLDTAYEELEVANEELYQAEAEVAEEQQRYKDLFQYSPVGYLVIDKNSVILEANRAANTMLQSPGEALIGRRFITFIDKNEWKTFRSLLNNQNRKEHVQEAEFHFMPPDQPAFEGLLTFAAPQYLHVKTSTFRLAIQDITPRKQAEKALRDIREKEAALHYTTEFQHMLENRREAERMSIARDLHDGPIQDIIVLSYDLAEVIKELGDHPVSLQLKGIRENINQVGKDLREFSSGLRSHILVQFGLAKAIRSHSEILVEKHPGLNVSLELNQTDDPLPEPLQLVLFRIYSEAMSNMLRHSSATEVCIRFSHDSNSATLEIHDNGTGFSIPEDWTNLIQGGHLGLMGIQERAESVNGTVQITSNPELGTLVRVDLPLV